MRLFTLRPYAMKLEQIKSLAQSLLDQLSSACVRIEIAGSIRRGKADPKDIEIVCIPSMGEYTVPIYEMFTDQITMVHQINYLDDAIGTLLTNGEWEFDPVIKRNGPRYKRLRHVTSQVCCDLFITDRRRWGLIFAIRTALALSVKRSLVMPAGRPCLWMTACCTVMHRLIMMLTVALNRVPLASAACALSRRQKNAMSLLRSDCNGSSHPGARSRDHAPTVHLSQGA